ncbi:carbon storage regulator [Candidatus Parcubacteria bacterium]|nr:MAG: carbon storage regulator [Candidatus Parcubacteria bacterium]
MLILTRKTGEAMAIGHDMRVEVLGVKGSQVKIGIQAPAQVRVLRDELLDRSREEESDDGT